MQLLLPHSTPRQVSQNMSTETNQYTTSTSRKLYKYTQQAAQMPPNERNTTTYADVHPHKQSYQTGGGIMKCAIDYKGKIDLFSPILSIVTPGKLKSVI